MCQISRHVLIADTLYRKSLDDTLLRCMDVEEAQLTLKEVHDGICGIHSSGPTLVNKILRTSYYWSTMEEDAYKYVQKYRQCHIHEDLIHAPAQDPQHIISPWPFS